MVTSFSCLRKSLSWTSGCDIEKLLGWVWRDLRFAFHSLSRDKRFTLLAVLALALGIGSVTVIFSAVYGVLIDTFPYAHYDRMVSFSMDEPRQGGGREVMTTPNFWIFAIRTTCSKTWRAAPVRNVHYIHGDQTTQWSVTRETANGYLSNVGNARPVSTSSAERSSWSRW